MIEVHFHTDIAGIRCKQHGKTGRAAALHILRFGEAFETAGINAVIRVLGIVKSFPHKIKLTSLDFKAPYRLLRINRKGYQQYADYKHQSFHDNLLFNATFTPASSAGS